MRYIKDTQNNIKPRNLVLVMYPKICQFMLKFTLFTLCLNLWRLKPVKVPFNELLQLP